VSDSFVLKYSLIDVILDAQIINLIAIDLTVKELLNYSKKNKGIEINSTP